MKLVVVIFAMTVTSLMVFKTCVHGKMFNCKMTEEPTMAEKLQTGTQMTTETGGI